MKNAYPPHKRQTRKNGLEDAPVRRWSKEDSPQSDSGTIRRKTLGRKGRLLHSGPTRPHKWGPRLPGISTVATRDSFPRSPSVPKQMREERITIDEVLEQIQSAFAEASVVDVSRPSVVLRNPNERIDHNGKLVDDEVIFECTGRHPNADLYSVIPRGDGRPNPKK